VPSSDPAQRFADITENIDRIEQFTKGLSAATFAASDQVTFAVKYALLVISEATAKLGDTAPGLHPDIPWREIRGLGNRLRRDRQPPQAGVAIAGKDRESGCPPVAESFPALARTQELC
jgi:uncharacterized protein with HEPN domain